MRTCGSRLRIYASSTLQRAIIRAIAEQARAPAAGGYSIHSGLPRTDGRGVRKNAWYQPRYIVAVGDRRSRAKRASRPRGVVRVLAAGAISVNKLQAIGDEPRTGRLLLRYDGTQWKVTGPTRSERLVSGAEP